MQHYLDFEKELAELEAEASKLRSAPKSERAKGDTTRLRRLDRKSAEMLGRIYGKLLPWQKCLVARHPNRPRCRDYLTELFTDRTYLSGDRSFSEDCAVTGCLARFEGRAVVVIGNEKGNDTRTRLEHNFGMARPEGYRKAIRLMDLADRFGLPVITIIDTPGAYPGKGAEERGQAEAIARSTERCLQLNVPLVSIVIGEGGSGGAVALATADRTAMLEHSIYSVISPEGCASILWKDSEKMQDAAEALRLTAQDLLTLGVIDRIVGEPVGGAHRHPKETIQSVGSEIGEMLQEVVPLEAGERLHLRHAKFLDMGNGGSKVTPAATA